MEAKAWYLSRTLWFNLIAAIALLVQSKTGFLIDVDAQAGILAVINLVLRAITSQSLEWKAPKPADNTAGFANVVVLLMCVSLVIIGAVVNGCATKAAVPVQTPPVVTGAAVTIAPAAKDNPMAIAGKSLLAVKTTIVTAAGATDALCKAGKIGPDKCARAKDAYELAKPAYDSAVDTYLLMSQGYANPAAFGLALGRVQAIANNLLELSGGI